MFHILCFSDFLRSKELDGNFESMEDSDLADNLKQFYCSVRTSDGTEYSRSGYRNLRSGIQRYLQSTAVGRNINLRTDKIFMAANQCYDGMLKELKRSGRDVSQHKKVIEESDMKK